MGWLAGILGRKAPAAPRAISIRARSAITCCGSLSTEANRVRRMSWRSTTVSRPKRGQPGTSPLSAFSGCRRRVSSG